MHAGEVKLLECNAGTVAGGSTFSHSATYACGTRAFHNDGQLAGRRPSGIHELQEQPTGEEGGILLLQHHAGERGRNYRDAAGDDHRGDARQRSSVSNERGVPLSVGVGGRGTATYTATALATGREITGLKCPSRERCSLTMPGCAVFPGTRFISMPYRPDTARPGLALPFPAPVSIAISGQNGIYVVADKTYWIPDEGRWRMFFLRRRFDGVPACQTLRRSVVRGEGVVIAGTQGNVKP